MSLPRWIEDVLACLFIGCGLALLVVLAIP